MNIYEEGQVANQSNTLYENMMENKLKSMTIFTPLSRESNHLDNFQQSPQNEEFNDNHLYHQNINKVDNKTSMIPREIMLITNKITI